MALITEVKVGEIYVSNYDFTNMHVNVKDSDILVILGINHSPDDIIEIGIAKSIEDAKNRTLTRSCSIEGCVLIGNCTKYKDPKKEPKLVPPVKRDIPTKRTSQEQFRIALSKH